MTPRPTASQLTIEQVGTITRVHFSMTEVLHSEMIDAVSEQLFALVEDEGCRRLLLDLSGVREVASAFLGRLIALHRLLLTLHGDMALCGLEPDVQRVFALCQLPRLLHIYETCDVAHLGLRGDTEATSTKRA